MKHVFLIGSHTPYLTALGAIEKNSIPSEDIIFLFGRNYKCDLIPVPYESFDISDKYYLYYKGNSRKKVLEHIQWIDSFIIEKICDDFTLYVPHLYFDLFQIFATNPLCVDIKLIQEAVVDFCVPVGTKPKFSFQDIYIRGWLLRGSRMWKTAGWNYPNKAKVPISETFATTDKLFSLVDCKHTIVNWPVVDTGLLINQDAPIFVFESAVERHDIEKEHYMESTKKLIMKYASSDNYVKFHPYQTKENVDEICAIFTSLGKKVSRLPDNVPFELLLCSKNKFKVVGFTTSLIYYAKLAGHESHICGPTLLVSSLFRKYWNEYSKRINEIYGDSFNYENLNNPNGQ